MKQITSKQRIVEAMQDLPDDATVGCYVQALCSGGSNKALANDDDKIDHEDIKSEVLEDGCISSGIRVPNGTFEILIALP